MIVKFDTYRRNKFILDSVVDRGVHEQLQVAAEPAFDALAPADGLLRLLLELL